MVFEVNTVQEMRIILAFQPTLMKNRCIVDYIDRECVAAVYGRQAAGFEEL